MLWQEGTVESADREELIALIPAVISRLAVAMDPESIEFEKAAHKYLDFLKGSSCGDEGCRL
jgi:hypothetical protein